MLTCDTCQVICLAGQRSAGALETHLFDFVKLYHCTWVDFPEV